MEQKTSLIKVLYVVASFISVAAGFMALVIELVTQCYFL
jgi:hypothetical protein